MMGEKNKIKTDPERRHQMNRRNHNSHTVQYPVMQTTGEMTLFPTGLLPMRNHSTSEIRK